MPIIACKIEKNAQTEEIVNKISNNFKRVETSLFEGMIFWREDTVFFCIKALWPPTWMIGIVGLVFMTIMGFWRWWLILPDIILWIPLLFEVPLLYKFLYRLSFRRYGYKESMEFVY